MKAQNNYSYGFESFHVDSAKRRLMQNGQAVSLTAKAFSTLLFLIENRGKIVTKEELMNAVWADTAVEENNLVQQISTLRKVLGEKTRHPRFITTIPGEGYIFIAPVTETNFDSAEKIERKIEQSHMSDEFQKIQTPIFGTNKNEQGKGGLIFKSQELHRLLFIFLPSIASAVIIFAVMIFSTSLSSKPTIGIAPFKALDSSEKSSFQSAGIPSYVTAKIGNLPNIVVRPLGSSNEHFGQEQNIAAIGRDNQVDSILTGSTQCEGDAVRVVVQLWDVKKSRLIWAKAFTGKASEAFSLQDIIAEEIVSVLQS